MIAFFVFLSFLILIFIGVPIAISMLLVGMIFVLVLGGGLTELIMPFNRLSSGFSFSLLAIYFFISLGVLMNETKLSDYIIDFLRKITGNIFKYGRTGMIMILSCAATGVLTGSAVGTTTAVGGIIVPQMEKLKYDKKYYTTLLAYSGTLGTLIPPSITGLIYAVITSIPVLTIWVAVAGAGILYTATLMLANYLISKKHNYEVYDAVKESLENISLKKSFFKAAPALIVPVGVLGSIYGGIATPTESGSIGCLATFLLGTFYYKTVKSVKQISQVIFESAYRTAVVMFLMCASFSLSHVLVTTGTIKKITTSMLMISDNKYVLLLLTELLILLLGCFLDDAPIILLLGPIANAILIPVGVHPVHLAVIFVFTTVVGLVTPPVGSVLYASSAVTGVPVGEIIMEIFSFLIPSLAVLLIITFFPSVCLFLPKLIGLL